MADAGPIAQNSTSAVDIRHAISSSLSKCNEGILSIVVYMTSVILDLNKALPHARLH